MRKAIPTLLAVVLLSAGAPRLAHADDAAVREAVGHFERGVALFSEADYRAALAEFRRAYEIAPNPGVLYNIAQTQFQLQNYAGALTAFERFLADAPPSAKHRDDAQSALQLLRTRVGKLEVTTNVPDAEIAVDDEVVGKAPLAKPVLASIGRRKITVSSPGRVPATRNVEVTAGDTVSVSLPLAGAEAGHDAAGPRSRPTDTAHDAAPGPRTIAAPPEPPRPRGLSGLAVGGWVTTGALAAGSVVTGILALGASSDLKDARTSFPATRADLDRKADKLTALSATADALGAAAIVAGALSIYFTVSSRGPVKVDAAAAWNGVTLRGGF